MLITAPRDALSDVLNAASITADQSPLKPVLSHCLINANGSVQLATHTLERSSLIECKDAVVQENGKTLLPLTPLQNLISGSAKGSKVQIEIGERATVTIGRSRYVLPILEADTFPEPLGLNAQGSITLEAVELLRMLACIVPAAADPGTLQHLAGVFLHFIDDELVCVASDNKRLHITSTSAFKLEGELPTQNSGKRPGITIPTATVNDIAKFATGVLELRISANVLEIVRSDNARYASKLIETTFPDYERFIPDPPPHAVRVDRKELIAGCNRLVGIGSSLGALASLSWEEDGEASISLYGGLDGGAEGHETFASECFGSCAVGLNLRHLLDALNGSSKEFVVIRASVPSAAVMVTLGADLTALLMPCKAVAHA